MHLDDNRRVTLRQCQIGRDRKPVRQGGQAAKFQAIISAWGCFLMAKPRDSRFRSFGQPLIDGHTIFWHHSVEFRFRTHGQHPVCRPCVQLVPVPNYGFPGQCIWKWKWADPATTTQARFADCVGSKADSSFLRIIATRANIKYKTRTRDQVSR